MASRIDRRAGRPDAAGVRRLCIPLLVMLLAGCALDSYPLLSGGGASQWAPVRVGSSTRGVVLFLEPHPGDRIELISAEPVGSLAGARVRLYFSRPVLLADGSRSIGDKLEPLAGATVSVDPNASPGPENDVGIVVEVTPATSGTFSLTAIRLHFRLNGGHEQVKEGISTTFTVCAANPAPTDCAPSPSE
jgi:hypothetical protein